MRGFVFVRCIDRLVHVIVQIIVNIVVIQRAGHPIFLYLTQQVILMFGSLLSQLLLLIFQLLQG